VGYNFVADNMSLSSFA